MNAQCTLVYDLPQGHNYKTFRALCGYDSSCDKDNPNSSGTTMEFIFYVNKTEPYTFDLSLLGYGSGQSVPVHDIWSNEDLGNASGLIQTTVPSHGVRLFRLGDKVSTDIVDKTILGNEKKDDAFIYDLMGRRVIHPKTGLYIVGGKKVWVK